MSREAQVSVTSPEGLPLYSNVNGESYGNGRAQRDSDGLFEGVSGKQTSHNHSNPPSDDCDKKHKGKCDRRFLHGQNQQASDGVKSADSNADIGSNVEFGSMYPEKVVTKASDHLRDAENSH